MSVKFNPVSAPNYFYNGVQDAYFFADGQIIAKFDYTRIELSKIDGDHVSSVSEYTAKLLTVNLSAVKRSNKIDLNRKNNFFVATSSDAYLPRPYDLYIYAGAGGDAVIIDQGEFKYMSGNDGAQDYMKNYLISFTQGAEVRTSYHEKIICDEYELQPGETWSNGEGTKDNKCVRLYDLKNSIFYKEGMKPEQGVIKSWRETATTAEPLSIHSPYITRTEKTAERIERENLAENLSKLLGVSVSERSLQEVLKQYNITRK